jgi:hypothetical protein
MLQRSSSISPVARRQPRRVRPYHRNGAQLAAVRAVTAARLWRGDHVTVTSQAEAATACGASLSYVLAAAVVLDAGNDALVADVLAGRVPLLTAARHVRKRARLLKAFRQASPADLAELGRSAGVGEVWDRVIVPSL